MIRQKVIIIGAGIGGIATANILARAGYEVVVYEKNAQPGGRAGLLQKDGFTFDTGPSWYLMPEVFEHHYDLLGTSVANELDIVQLQPAYKVFFEHEEPVTIETDARRDRQLFESIETGAGAAFDRYVVRSVQTYDIALRHFLYTNFQSLTDFFKWEVIVHGPRMLVAAFRSVDSYVSGYFKDHRLKKIMEYTMVFLGASPYKAPAIYSLMSALDFRYGVFYPRGGMYSVIKSMVRLSRDAGVTYQYDSPIVQIVSSDGRATGVKLADGTIETADIIVSNADLHFTETQLLSAEDQTYPGSYWRDRDPGPSALLLYLGVSGKLGELEHHSLLFVDDWKGNFDAIYESKSIPESASIYVSKATASDPDYAPAGHEALVVLVPFPADVTIGAAEQEQLADRYIEQIARMTGIHDLPSRIVSRTIMGPGDFVEQFHAWRATALGPAHTLRQSAFFRTGNKSKKLDNLYYVGGSTLPGIGLPMCLIGAELVYKHLAGDKKSGRVGRIDTIGGDASS